jgi:threonine/homoserine/homoserine lactone efflux protein
MLPYLIQGFGYGLAAAAQPGPLQTFLVSQSISKGWQKSLPAALAPLVSDGPIIAIVLFVLTQIPEWLQRVLYIAGGLFILYLAYNTFLAWKNFVAQEIVTESSGTKNMFQAALTNILNPAPYIYWSLVTGPILLAGWRETPANGIGFLVSFYATMVCGLAAIIIIFGTARRLGPTFNRILLAISAIALVCFGVYQLWLGIFGGHLS